jgi:hypothetical protein
VNPCAIIIASVQPSRHDASSSNPSAAAGATDLYYAQTSAVLDHSRTLPQGDGDAGPTLAGGVEGGERKLIVLDAGDVFDGAFAVRSPGINAEVSSRCGHGNLDASSRARRMAASTKVVILLPVVQPEPTR